MALARQLRFFAAILAFGASSLAAGAGADQSAAKPAAAAPQLKSEAPSLLESAAKAKPQAGQPFVNPFKPVPASAAPAPPAAPTSAASPAVAVPPSPVPVLNKDVKVRPPEELSRADMPGAILKFDNADIYEVLQAVLGDMLHLNFIVDPTIQGKVTINTLGSVSQADIFNILESILSLNNLSLIRDGKLYKVVKDANAPRDRLTFEALGEGSPLIQIIPVKFVQASALIATLRNFIGPQAGITNDPTNHYLVIADRASNVSKIMDMVKVLDVDYLQHVKIKGLQIEKGDALEMAREMETLFKTSGMFNWPGTDGNKIFFMPIIRMNALLVAAANDAVLEAAEKWIKVLDDEPKDGVGSQIHVYSIENSTATRIANILRQIYGGAPITPAGTDATKVVIKGNVPSVGVSGAGLSGNVQIIPDEATNTLVIKASPQDFLQMKKIIERIDLIPRQVLIQVMVAEVGLTDKTQFGVEWWLQHEHFSNRGQPLSANAVLGTGLNVPSLAAGTTNTINTLTTSSPGFNYFLFNNVGDVVGMFNALSETTDVNILSSPHVMASDGHEAKIEVGKEVPYITQTVATPSATTTTTGLTTSNSINYKTVGILLNVKPHVNASGLVNLVLTQEVSDISDTSVNGIQSPVFTKRKVETEVTLQEGKTLLIAGLIQDNVNNINRGLPGFKDIPVLGYLFGAKNDNHNKTELMITITPYVVRNNEEGDRVTAAFQENLKDLKAMVNKVKKMDPSKKPAAAPAEKAATPAT
ncbi:MAG: type II secretion system secretin GspD [Burkholderiales bacterium]